MSFHTGRVSDRVLKYGFKKGKEHIPQNIHTFFFLQFSEEWIYYNVNLSTIHHYILAYYILNMSEEH